MAHVEGGLEAAPLPRDPEGNPEDCQEGRRGPTKGGLAEMRPSRLHPLAERCGGIRGNEDGNPETSPCDRPTGNPPHGTWPSGLGWWLPPGSPGSTEGLAGRETQANQDSSWLVVLRVAAAWCRPSHLSLQHTLFHRAPEFSGSGRRRLLGRQNQRDLDFYLSSTTF